VAILSTAITLAALVLPPLQGPDSGWSWRHEGRLLTRRDLDSVLALHGAWVASAGRRGRQADLSRALLPGADLRHANLERAVLSGTVLQRATLTAANLRGADLQHVNLVGAVLDSAILDSATLDGANLAGASVRGATLRDAVSQAAVLAGARLEGVDLAVARWLRDVRWTAVLDDGSFLEGAYYDSRTRWPVGYRRPANLGSLRSKVGRFVSGHSGSFLLALFALGFAGALVAARVEAANEKRQKQAVANAEKLIAGEGTLVEHIQAELRLLTERERLNLVLASSRSRWLFGLGTSLIVLSILGPVISALIYLDSATRDWHFLAFGVSAGLLFIAAARGIARQEAHQRDTYFRLTLRVTRYERFISAMRIASRASGATDEGVKRLYARILDHLLEPDNVHPESIAPPQPSPGANPSIAEIVGSLIDRTSEPT